MSGQQGRPVDETFVDLVAELRWLGYCDDAIAHRYGISVEGLHKRFAKFGIPQGRRWRDIEDARLEPPMTKAAVRRIAS